MKKLLAMLVAGTMVVSLAACGGSGTSAQSTSQDEGTEAEAPAGNEEAEGQTFTVGFDAEYPPYGYLDVETNDYTGFDLELAEEVCNRRGWKLVKKPINWDNKDAEIDSGSIDCIWSGMTYTGREEQYTWSDPYVDNTIVIAVAADSDIKTLDDLAGKVVITQSESSALTALESDELANLTSSFADLQQSPSYNTCFQDLEAGAVEAIAVDVGPARAQIAKSPDKFRMLDEPISSEQLGVAFKLGNTELRDQVQETLDEMIADGTFLEIANHYADDNIPDMVILKK